MRRATLSFFLASLVLPAARAQTPAAPAREPSFTEAVEAATRAFTAGEHASAVASLQAAILVVQKLQRAAIVAALPRPAGFVCEDVQPKTDATDPFAAGIATLGFTVERRCRKGDKVRLDLEVSSNSPMVEMYASLFAAPDKVKASGGEILALGRHKAVLKEADGHVDLTVVVNGRHIVKVDSDGMKRDEVLALVDAAFVDRIEKPLGR